MKKKILQVSLLLGIFLVLIKLIQKDTPQPLIPEREISRIKIISKEGVTFSIFNDILLTTGESFVDRKKLDEYLKFLGSISLPDKSLDSSDTEDYGLNPPESVMIFEGESLKKVLSFGALNAVSKRRYLQIEGEKGIFLLPEGIYKALNKIPAYFLKKELLNNFPTEKVTRINIIQREGEGFSILKDKDHWKLLCNDKSFPVEEPLVKSDLDGLKALKIDEVIFQPGETLAFYGLNSPELIVNFELEKGYFLPKILPDYEAAQQNPIFQIGKGIKIKQYADNEKPKTAYFLKVNGIPRIFQLESDFFKDITLGCSNLINKNLFIDLHLIEKLPCKEFKVDFYSEVTKNNFDKKLELKFKDGGSCNILADSKNLTFKSECNGLNSWQNGTVSGFLNRDSLKCF